jgi:hypothetical protein
MLHEIGKNVAESFAVSRQFDNFATQIELE